MQTKISSIIIVAITLLLISCAPEETEPTIVATEVWGFIMDNDSSNHGEATFEKKSDGSISTTAVWRFVHGLDSVVCPVENGSAIVEDDSILINAQGIATNANPAIPAGYNTSPFAINVKGYANNGQAQGQWSIAFSGFGWPPSLQGTFTATRKSGSGVTQ